MEQHAVVYHEHIHFFCPASVSLETEAAGTTGLSSNDHASWCLSLMVTRPSRPLPDQLLLTGSLPKGRVCGHHHTAEETEVQREG